MSHRDNGKIEVGQRWTCDWRVVGLNDAGVWLRDVRDPDDPEFSLFIAQSTLRAHYKRDHAYVANVEPVDDATERTVLADYLTKPNDDA